MNGPDSPEGSASDSIDAELHRHIADLRQQRTELLAYTWATLARDGLVDPRKFTLSHALVRQAVEFYLDDYVILRQRYRVDKTHRLQRPKVAGLMAAALLRFRPIIPYEGYQGDVFENEDDVYINEIFALFHGIDICSEADEGAIKTLAKEPWVNDWMGDMAYNWHYRNYTTEGIITVFSSICRTYFPNCFASGEPCQSAAGSQEGISASLKGEKSS